MRRLAGEWIFRQMQMQIPKVYWRVIEESACRRWRKRQSQTHRRIVRCCLKEISAIAGFVSDLSAAILAAPFPSVRSCSPAAYISIRMETRVWYPPSLLRKPFGFRPNSTKPARRYMLSARSFSATAVSSSWV